VWSAPQPQTGQAARAREAVGLAKAVPAGLRGIGVGIMAFLLSDPE
jgi:hypothetical protein